jgi:3-hydroxyacyl-[acyl-carrier-protein] dehydratase
MTPIGRFTIGPDHPSLPGHFPGHPVVPGVVLLDEVLACLPGATLLTAKFTAPVEPGMEVEIQRRTEPSGRTTFVCLSGGRTVLQGTVA